MMQLKSNWFSKRWRLIASVFVGSILFTGIAWAEPVRREGTSPFVKWTVQSDADAIEMHNPIVVNETVIVGNDRGDLCAYRCADGTLLWRHAHGKRIYAQPRSDGENVYFTSDDGLVAVTAKAGKAVWSFGIATGGGPTLAVREKESVLVGGNDGMLYSLHAKTGEVRWKSDFVADAPPDRPGFPGEKSRVNFGVARPSAISSDGDAIYVSVFDQSRLVAIDAANGKRLWSFQAGGWILGSASMSKTHVFIGSQDCHMYCLDKRDGKQVWRFETKKRIEAGGVVDQANIYFGSCDGTVYCLNHADGKERWRFAADLRRDGKPSALYSVPLLRSGRVVFAAGEGQLYAISASTGELVWKLRAAANSDLYCSPVTDGERYFVVSQPSGDGAARRGIAALVAVELK